MPPCWNGFALWLFLNILIPKEQHACEFYDCWEEHSHCSTLCEGGRWLDLTKEGAKATQHETYLGFTYRASKAIDGNPRTCAIFNVGDRAILLMRMT